MVNRLTIGSLVADSQWASAGGGAVLADFRAFRPGETDMRGFHPATADRARVSLIALRCVLAALLAIHGWARLLAGGVAPFADWLNQQGLLIGPLIAWSVTLLEMFATVLLALGWQVRILSLLFAAIYLCGLILVHWPAGWFVVGLGRNGMEYSVLLIACLLAMAYAHPRKQESASV